MNFPGPEHFNSTEPPVDENWETSFAGVVRQSVDTLFAQKEIAEKLQGTEDDKALETFIDQEKQWLTQHLQERAWLMVDFFLASVKAFRAEQDSTVSPPLPETKDQPQTDIEKLYQPFPIASVCRADLQGIITDEEISRLDDSDMERIADKMSDSYRDAGGYWEALEIMARDVLARQGGQ